MDKRKKEIEELASKVNVRGGGGGAVAKPKKLLKKINSDNLKDRILKFKESESSKSKGIENKLNLFNNL